MDKSNNHNCLSVFLVLLIILFWSSNTLAKTIKLVTLQYPPYIYQSREETKGIAVEIIKEAFKRMNQPIDIQLLPWTRAIDSVKNGETDAIFTVYKNKDREKFLYYADEPIVDQVVSLFTQKSSKIKFNGDLKGIQNYSIGLVRSVSYGEELDEAIKNNVFKNIQYVDTGEQNIKMLLHGRIDILVSNRLGALSILKDMGRVETIHALGSIAKKIPSYIAFSKKNELTQTKHEFDRVLSQMKTDGTLAKYTNSLNGFYK